MTVKEMRAGTATCRPFLHRPTGRTSYAGLPTSSAARAFAACRAARSSNSLCAYCRAASSGTPAALPAVQVAAQLPPHHSAKIRALHRPATQGHSDRLASDAFALGPEGQTRAPNHSNEILATDGAGGMVRQHRPKIA